MSKPRNNWNSRPNRPREYWRNRAIILKGDPACSIAIDGICTVKATETDHIVPVWKAVKELLPDGTTIEWADRAAGIGIHDLVNLRPACKACNAEMNYRTRPKPKRPSLRRPPEKHPGLI